jgi:hypothetical protein
VHNYWFSKYTIDEDRVQFLLTSAAYSEKMKLYVSHEAVAYDMCSISEKTGGEIAFQDEDGWISNF